MAELYAWSLAIPQWARPSKSPGSSATLVSVPPWSRRYRLDIYQVGPHLPFVLGPGVRASIVYVFGLHQNAFGRDSGSKRQRSAVDREKADG